MAKVGRRRILLGLGGALVATGGAIAVVRTRGYDLPPERAESLVVLRPWQAIVVDALASRIAATDDPGVPTADDVGVTAFVDQYVAAMAAPLRRDLMGLLGFIEHVAPLGKGFSSRFSRLPPERQDAVLASLEAHDQGMLRGAFAAVKALVFMGYYRDPRTWLVLGYTGPLVAGKGAP
jgi:hypothetical protein